jgi:hypothetical protein
MATNETLLAQIAEAEADLKASRATALYENITPLATKYAFKLNRHLRFGTSRAALGAHIRRHIDALKLQAE